MNPKKTTQQNTAYCPPLENRTRIFPSMSQASTVLNIPLKALSFVKRQDCRAFRSNNSVSEKELVEWLARQLIEWELYDEGRSLDDFATPPTSDDFWPIAGKGEAHFQIYRLFHGDEIMGRVKSGFEADREALADETGKALRKLGGLLSGYGGRGLGNPFEIPQIPILELGKPPFEVFGINRLYYWIYAIREYYDYPLPKPFDYFQPPAEFERFEDPETERLKAEPGRQAFCYFPMRPLLEILDE